MRAATPASRRRRPPGEPSVARLEAMLLVRPPPQSAEGTRPLHAFRPRSTPATRRARASRTRRPAGREPPPPPPLDANQIGRTTPGTSWWSTTAARRPDRHRCPVFTLHRPLGAERRVLAPLLRINPHFGQAGSAHETPAGPPRSETRMPVPPRDGQSARGASRPSIAERSALASHRQPPPAGSGGPTVPSCTLARGGGEERRTDHRIAAGREQPTCRPAWYAYLPIDPLQIMPRAGQTGRPGGHRGHCGSRSTEPPSTSFAWR